jgi:hypothetical protein
LTNWTVVCLFCNVDLRTDVKFLHSTYILYGYDLEYVLIMNKKIGIRRNLTSLQ